MTKWKSTVISYARALLASQVDPLESCRRIVGLVDHNSADAKDPDFAYIMGVESETEVFLTGRARENCAPEYLARLDRERASYFQKIDSRLRQACESLIRKWSTD